MTTTRRSFLLGAGLAPLGAAPYETPYKYPKLVLPPGPDPNGFDGRSVDCPFVFRHAGRFHLVYTGFDGTGYQTGLATSTNLVDWHREGCILARDPASPITRYNVSMSWILRENGLRSAGHLRKIDGQFLGVYHAYPNAGYEEGAAVIGLCRSTDLRHWRLDPPCLRAEDGAAWERGGLYKPCLVEDKDTFYLFYNAKTAAARNWVEQTGVATSKDLKSWTRHAANPLIPNGPAGSPDERFASDPCVLRDGRRWLMFYYGLDAKGVARDLLATGDSPFAFEKSDRTLIDVGPPGSIDSTYAHKPSVISSGGTLYHFYCAVSGRWPNQIRGLAVARSTPWPRTGDRA
jgi:predicted GH43/DUF377 family glycosyl hydrolase